MTSPNPDGGSLPGCQEPDAATRSKTCNAAITAHGRCLAHLTAEQRAAHLGSLTLGSPINGRGFEVVQKRDGWWRFIVTREMVVFNGK